MAKAVQLKDKAGNKVYAAPYFPIGSIYLTVGNYNPSTYFGGKWEKISGGFLYGCVNSIDNNVTNTPGTETYNHTLTIDQIPSHTHNLYGAMTGETKNISNVGNVWIKFMNNKSWNLGDSNTNTGGGQGHSHDIPHIGVWVWKRIA